MSDELDLGPCCLCERADGVRNIVMLPRRAPIAGHGWGCIVCELPADGAIAVLCDGCLKAHEAGTMLKHCCRGYPAAEGRIAIDDLPPDRFDHYPGPHAEDIIDG